MTDSLAVALAVVLATVHLFAGRLAFLGGVPRSRLLSVAGGVSVAYVFVHVLPEIARARRTIDASGSVLVVVEKHVYLVALLGFVTFYGLEQFVGRERSRSVETSDGVFWVHVVSFALYNGLVGYLLFHREDTGIASLVTFAVAMAFHFVVNDFGLRDHHADAYRRLGRWVLAGGVGVGATVGVATEIGPAAVAVLFAFLGGSVILNAIKEELPAERESRFSAFALGAGGYGLLLLAL